MASSPRLTEESAAQEPFALTTQLTLGEIGLESLVESEPADTDHGAVFTRPWVVNFILDLAGYDAEKDLAAHVAVEPACGDGAFLLPMIERLLVSLERHERGLEEAAGAIRALDLQLEHVRRSQAAATELLLAKGYAERDIRAVVPQWVAHGDFILQQSNHPDANFVVGNPPYVRLESVPAARSQAYRRLCTTMSGRADLYVGFYEVGLRSLTQDGTLAFICADRWMRNQYGRALRQLVSEHFSLEIALEIHDVDAFAEEVSAYPSIVVVRRRKQGPAVIAEAGAAFDAAAAADLSAWQRGTGSERASRSYRAARLPSWFSGPESWPTGSPERVALVRDLERRLPPLEDRETETRVGIGVATGADEVFITDDRSAAEPDRMLPLALAPDTMTGELRWSGHYLVDPWSRDGNGLVGLSEYPKLRSYYEENEHKLRRRNVAGRRPTQWYRTIDRVDHSLTACPKLFLPDIKATIHPVLDEGRLYPHHNLYFVVSRSWDLEVLGGLLLSRVAQLFVESYAVRMRGGYLRFQAQYLRRIRVPHQSSVGARDATRLREAFRLRDVDSATKQALKLYGIAEVPS